MGVKVTVDPTVWTRHGLGGWMEMMTMFGKVGRTGGPGGYTMVSMFTVPTDWMVTEVRW
jgi:hypothetical protein